VPLFNRSTSRRASENSRAPSGPATHPNSSRKCSLQFPVKVGQCERNRYNSAPPVFARIELTVIRDFSIVFGYGALSASPAEGAGVASRVHMEIT
jgi:hypothetical protein